MKKNKSAPKKNLQLSRQNLINKISDAMTMKYNNFFTAANYDTKTLKEDIGKLLSTQYYSKDPRDVFKPIETNILDIVKKKNPQLQVKVKKARKLPEIKYTKDKYQEADELEKEKEEKNNPPVTQKPKLHTKKNNINIPKKETTKTKNRTTNDKTKTNNTNKIQLTDINNNINNNDNINEEKKEEISNTMYKIQQEYGIKHTLVDQLNNRIKNDPTIKYLDEEKKLYEKEQEEKKQKKLLEQKNYLNELKCQVEERDRRKEEEKKIKQKELEEIQKQIINDNEKLKKQQMDEKIKREKLKQNYDNLMKEKDNIKRQKKLEEDKENKILFQLINEEIINEKKNILEKKNKIKEEILKTMEINEKLAKERNNSEKQNDIYGEEKNILQTNSLTNNVIKERINKRAMEQEAAGNYLLKIYNSKEKQDQDAYIIEREKQEQRKKLEYELADKTRQMKIDDYRKSLLDTLEKKNLEKEKQKEEDAKYRKSLEEEYNLYLKEEKERKLKQIEKYENYRKALEEQIKENKIRDFEKVKYK